MEGKQRRYRIAHLIELTGLATLKENPVGKALEASGFS